MESKGIVCRTTANAAGKRGGDEGIANNAKGDMTNISVVLRTATISIEYCLMCQIYSLIRKTHPYVIYEIPGRLNTCIKHYDGAIEQLVDQKEVFIHTSKWAFPGEHVH